MVFSIAIFPLEAKPVRFIQGFRIHGLPGGDHLKQVASEART
jgi:hypothetical protein